MIRTCRGACSSPICSRRTTATLPSTFAPDRSEAHSAPWPEMPGRNTQGDLGCGTAPQAGRRPQLCLVPAPQKTTPAREKTRTPCMEVSATVVCRTSSGALCSQSRWCAWREMSARCKFGDDDETAASHMLCPAPNAVR